MINGTYHSKRSGATATLPGSRELLLGKGQGEKNQAWERACVEGREKDGEGGAEQREDGVCV